jgi:hypothetical protein
MLSEAGGRPVALDESFDVLREHDGYVTVARFRTRAPSDLPPTVIAKRPGNWAPFDAASPESAAWGFFNEWAALEFLSGTGLAPSLLAGDRESGLLVMEDLGDGDGLADSLLGADETGAEADLLAFADALARLHSFSALRVAEYHRIRERLGPTRVDDPRDELQQLIAGLRAACDRVGVTLTRGAEDDIARAFELMELAGLRVLSHGDACPDNTRIIGGQMRFIDFWVSRVRHALLDGAYARSPFPTCWCVRRIPERIVIAMENRYRVGVVDELPALRDDAVFTEHLVAALALWLVEIFRWQIPLAMEKDELMYRDVHTRRQGVFLRWETFRAAVDGSGRFGEVAALGDQLIGRLRMAWPDVPEVSFYPAFAG